MQSNVLNHNVVLAVKCLQLNCSSSRRSPLVTLLSLTQKSLSYFTVHTVNLLLTCGPCLRKLSYLVIFAVEALAEDQGSSRECLEGGVNAEASVEVCGIRGNVALHLQLLPPPLPHSLGTGGTIHQGV